MSDARTENNDTLLRCDCGYACLGATLQDRAHDGRRHALEAHGIDVGADQVITEGAG